jgi:hypothetical protein
LAEPPTLEPSAAHKLVRHGRHYPGTTGSFIHPGISTPHGTVLVIWRSSQECFYFWTMFVGEASTLLFNFVIWPAVKPMFFNSFIGLELKPLLDLLS